MCSCMSTQHVLRINLVQYYYAGEVKVNIGCYIVVIIFRSAGMISGN